MLKYITIAMSFIFSNALMAHQPDISSTMLVEQSEGKWVLQIRAALTAFEYTIKYGYPDSTYASPDEFKNLLTAFVEDNIVIKGHNFSTTLSNPIVKLGHETNVIFEVKGIPSDLKTLKVTNSTFKSINKNQSAFILVKDNFEKDQFILNNHNAHSIEVKLDHKRQKIVLISEAEVSNQFSWKYILIGALFFFSIALLFIRNKKVITV